MRILNFTDGFTSSEEPTVEISVVASGVAIDAIAGLTAVNTQEALEELKQNIDDIETGAATVPDATTSVKGKLKLAGDLGGTADLPTVPALADKVNKTTTVNGQALSSNVTLSKTDIGLSNVDNTSDTNKPISTATQTALDGKYSTSNPSGYVDSSGAAAAAPVQSVAGKTGTVSLVKADVGLSNVDNTSDANKPISTATQTALDLKSNLLNDTGTGSSIISDSSTGKTKKIKAGNNVSLSSDADSVTVNLNDGYFNHDEIAISLSSGDTVETWVYKLATTTVKTLTRTFTNNTRTVLVSEVWS